LHINNADGVKNFAFILLSIITLNSFSQGEVAKPFPNRTETSFAIYLNSNGWGVNFHYGKRIDGYRRTLYSIDFAEIKHPKEVKMSNPYFNSGKKFVFGKLNEFYALRISYGRLKILYEKFDKGGIAINRFYQAGVSLGLEKPVYYYVIYPTQDPNIKVLREEKFNYSMHRVTDIYSKAPYFSHVDEIQFVPGVFFRYGYSFDFSTNSYMVNSLSCGAQIDFFPKEIEIMANTNNSNYFLSLFVGYRFGKANKNRINYNE
jgi:hypothetical protein